MIMGKRRKRRWQLVKKNRKANDEKTFQAMSVPLPDKALEKKENLSSQALQEDIDETGRIT